MKILQVVTWVAPGNPFGGPVRVALNQVAELHRRGHEVEIVAARPSRRHVGSWRSDSQGVHGFGAVRVVPAAGFSGLISIGLLRHVWRTAGRVDVAHIHLARDLVTLPAAAVCRLLRTPYVLQCHGMIDRSDRRSARILDRLLTRRVLASARSILVLTEHESNELSATFPDLKLRLELVPNGVPIPDVVEPSRSSTVEVLFCSRLHARKRPLLFVRCAVELLEQGSDATFSVVGSDEGEHASITEFLAGHPQQRIELEPSIEPEAVAERLARCAVLVLPSVDEPFPMVVLEALAAGRPVVITDTCGLADFVTSNGCGAVVPSDDLGALAEAVSRMIGDPAERERMGAAGRRAVDEQLGMGTIGDHLEALYASAAVR